MEKVRYNDGEIRLMVNDDPDRVISFNPEDIGFINRYFELCDFIERKQEEYLKEAAEIDKLEKGRERRGFCLYQTMCEDIKGQIDYVFGEGTSKAFFGDSIRLDMFEQFLSGIVLYVQKARADKMRPYLEQKAGGVL